MHKGDILLIKYKFDPIGWIIRIVLHSQWNHTAWALDDHNLIELKATGRKNTPLKKYMNKLLYKCKLIRIKDLYNCKVEKAVERAKKAKFDYPYSSSIINYIAIKLKISKEVPRLSCSSFIAYYLSQFDFRFNDKNIHFITPKDIEESGKIIDVSHELCSLNTSI